MSSFFYSISDILDIVEHPIENIINNRCLTCLSSTINVNRDVLGISMYSYFQTY